MKGVIGGKADGSERKMERMSEIEAKTVRRERAIA